MFKGIRRTYRVQSSTPKVSGVVDVKGWPRPKGIVLHLEKKVSSMTYKDKYMYIQSVHHQDRRNLYIYERCYSS